MLGHHRGGVGGRIALGRGVELPADILDRFVELARRPLARALEHHMLEDVGEAVQMRRLVARPAPRENADRGRLQPGHVAADDAQAIVECRQLHHRGVFGSFSRFLSASP